MYKTFITILTAVFLLDVFNLQFMEWLDTTLPINALAWLLIWISVAIVQDELKDNAIK